MPTELPPGLYEALLTDDLDQAVTSLTTWSAQRRGLAEETAPEILSRHLSALLVRSFRSTPSTDRLRHQVELANRLVQWLSREAGSRAAIDSGDCVAAPGELLLQLTDPQEARLGSGQLERPSIPLRNSDLIVNGPRDLRVGHELQHELVSADRVDVIVSFLKWSGLRVILPQLRRFLERRPGGLRVLTTTYTGATEARAIETLLELGAEVRVSYDSQRTRLHAKAWMFHRASRFSTALVGSSNLSHSALVDGCEWNVRLSQVDNAPLLTKFRTTFEQYWAEDSFEAYDKERFHKATASPPSSALEAVIHLIELNPYPHQQQVLDALAEEREHGHNRNLVIAATGTGKTVVAALDFARLHRDWKGASLLFVAHRKEILEQSRATFRVALKDASFGELLHGGSEPVLGRHVFASIQSLQEARLSRIAADAYDVVVVDEFHHAAAPTYQRLLSWVQPKVLLGLTATPERTDGQSILGWFGGRKAAELRLWDALDLNLLVPFQYFGLHDGTDLSEVDFRAGRYHLKTLETLYTGDHVRAQSVLRRTVDIVHDVSKMRALGFCVTIAHAHFMASFFTSKGIPSLAVSGRSARAERAGALSALRSGQAKVLFAVDLFNEGIDIPAVDTVLFLRPTESATVFLQQLGRGLRIAEGKECLTVLDFIGNSHRKFRFDRRFRAILGGTRAQVQEAIEKDFPSLPAGCDIRLDEEAREVVLRNIRDAIRLGRRGWADDLAQTGDIGLRRFLQEADVELEELYKSGGGYTRLLHQAGLRAGPTPQSSFTRAMERMLHIDDQGRLDAWTGWLARTKPPEPDPSDPMQLMFFAVTGNVRRHVSELGDSLSEIWTNPDLRSELRELLEELRDRLRKSTRPMDDLPFHIHATYSRDEISAGLLQLRNGKLLRTQGGVYKDEDSRSDVLYVTLEKDEKEFTPTTLYNDFAVSPTRFHWESQGATRANSATGKRYQQHSAMDWRILLFVRRSTSQRGVTSPFLFLGPVHYVSHESEKPMEILWDLEHRMPPGFWNEVKVAAG